MIRVRVHAVCGIAVAALLAVSGNAFAQGAPAGDGPPVLAKQLAPAQAGALRLQVSSSAFSNGRAFPEKYTQNGDNMSPPLQWFKGPAGTVAYAVLAEDSGVNRKEPIVHWVIYNLPGTQLSLPVGVPATPTLDTGAMQGKNIRGDIGYIGPKPPAGQTHPYHFQVFALNTKLDLPAGTADRNAVVAAMKGHVLAQGDLIGNYTGK